MLELSLKYNNPISEWKNIILYGGPMLILWGYLIEKYTGYLEKRKKGGDKISNIRSSWNSLEGKVRDENFYKKSNTPPLHGL
ncbi:MAG: hypothetical protein QXU40_03155 [Candidatus Pacearchaeota archaeon]